MARMDLASGDAGQFPACLWKLTASGSNGGSAGSAGSGSQQQPVSAAATAAAAAMSATAAVAAPAVAVAAASSSIQHLQKQHINCSMCFNDFESFVLGGPKMVLGTIIDTNLKHS